MAIRICSEERFERGDNMWSWILNLVAVVVVFSALGCGSDPEHMVVLTYDASLSENQRGIVEDDLRFFANLENLTSSTGPELLGISDFSSLSLSYWLAERVKYIVGNTYDENSFTVHEEDVDYGDDTSNKEDPSDEKDVSIGVLNGQDTQILMANYGGVVYLEGKKESKIYSISVANTDIVVASPRVGVILAGDYVFTLQTNDGSVEDDVMRFFRLSVLFHEARHSDGNGSNVCFPHSECPEGHDYEGSIGCDTASNGAYQVSVVTLNAFYEACNNCDSKDHEVLTALIADFESRILDDAATMDIAPERIR